MKNIIFSAWYPSKCEKNLKSGHSNVKFAINVILSISERNEFFHKSLKFDWNWTWKVAWAQESYS